MLATTFGIWIGAGALALTAAAASPRGRAQVKFRAFQWSTWRAASRGDPQAQVRMGWWYATGISLPQSYARANNWYRLAADQGHPEAMTAMATHLAAGHGVPADEGQALDLLRAASALGDLPAKRILGLWHLSGKGPLAASEETAVRLWSEAAAAGDYDSLNNLVWLHQTQAERGNPRAESILQTLADQGRIKRLSSGGWHLPIGPETDLAAVLAVMQAG